jgi:cysteine desulfurase/selenocysteine lyase
MLAAERRLELRFIPLNDTGELELSALPRLFADGKVKLVSFVHVSNVLGTVNPVAEIARIARQHGATVVLDASQSAAHMPLDVKTLGVDFLACTAHKMLGPTGIGVLWGRRELLEAMPPFLGGGEMIRTVTLTESTWNELPWKFEAGTMCIAEAVGLGAAVQWLQRIGMEHVFAHDRELAAYAMARLAELKGVRLLGPAAEKRGGVVAFTVDGVHPHDVATVLDRDGICVRAGHHCAMPLHDALGVPASVRASFHCYSLREDVDALVTGLHRVQELFAR